eukprot:scaffold229567_cov30-Tisochrysis_lutea.AAC.1
MGWGGRGMGLESDCAWSRGFLPASLITPSTCRTARPLALYRGAQCVGFPVAGGVDRSPMACGVGAHAVRVPNRPSLVFLYKKNFLTISLHERPCITHLQLRPLPYPPIHLPCGSSPRALPRGLGPSSCAIGLSAVSCFLYGYGSRVSGRSRASLFPRAEGERGYLLAS